MHNKKKILIIGRHADMLQRIMQLVAANGYEVVGATGNEEAVSIFKSQLPDAVIIGGGVDEESRQSFKAGFLEIKPAIKIIDAHPQTVLKELEKTFQ